MSFRVGITRDVRRADGTIAYAEEGLRALRDAGIAWEFLPHDGPEVRAEDARDFDALLVAAPSVGREALAGARLALVARLGVGCDTVDLDAAREYGVLVTIAPEAVRGPMASAALALILALAHKLPAKDALVRSGRWHDRFEHVGVGLDGRTLGLVGFGNVGREVARLAQAFGMRVLAFTPRLTSAEAGAAGVERAELEPLLRRADVVCLVCPLTPDTHRLIDRDRIALMKESAFLVNVARGAVVDQRALVDALRDGAIRGAGLDVLEAEPPATTDPLLALENVILAPHALGHVDRLMVDGYAHACGGIVAVATGRLPEHVVDAQVWRHPSLRGKLAARSSGLRARRRTT